MRKILLTGVVGEPIAAVLIGSVKARDLDVSVMPLAAGRIDGICERNAFRVVVTKPGIGHVFIGEDLQMVSVSDLTRGVDIDPDRHECASITGDIAGCRCGGNPSPAKGLVPRNWGPRAA